MSRPYCCTSWYLPLYQPLGMLCLVQTRMSPVRVSREPSPALPLPSVLLFLPQLQLPGILQQRLQLPFPRCCGKHNLVRIKKVKTLRFICRMFCCPFVSEDFNFNPAVNYQLVCFMFSRASCSNRKASSAAPPSQNPPGTSSCCCTGSAEQDGT